MKYGKEITTQMAELLAGGMGRVDSCEFAGISYETFTVWMDKKPEFSEAIKRAEMVCKQRNIARIQNASKKSCHKRAARGSERNTTPQESRGPDRSWNTPVPTAPRSRLKAIST